jgi:hypothetical protein
MEDEEISARFGENFKLGLLKILVSFGQLLGDKLGQFVV